MRCWWREVREEAGRRGPPPTRTTGLQWAWTGKHRRGDDGQVVCYYRTPARGQATTRAVERGQPACARCGRVVAGVDAVHWQHYRRWRVRQPVSMLPWFRADSPPARPLQYQSHPWTWLHQVGENGQVTCRYQTRWKRWRRMAGGCRRCGRPIVRPAERHRHGLA